MTVDYLESFYVSQGLVGFFQSVFAADESPVARAPPCLAPTLPLRLSLTPPEGLSQPVRGFGKVWREQLGRPQAEVGWALERERGYEMLVQPFDGGQMFAGAEGEVFVLYTDETWESEGVPITMKRP